MIVFTRPVHRRHVRALESQVASLESFLRKVASAGQAEREQMLSAYASSSVADRNQCTSPLTARSRSGQMRNLTSRNASQFYGGTSLFQMHLSDDWSVPLISADQQAAQIVPPRTTLLASDEPGGSNYDPHHEVCRHLVKTFFRQSYQYNMFIYREYFLRDYDAGYGRYYSDLLLYSMCATSAPLSEDPDISALSNTFVQRAHALLYLTLENPDLTTLQSLILLGHMDIGQGRASKGWLFCGMAFRLAHEMGLHLDPSNWAQTSKSPVDREILRRVYWAAFAADKQLSLHFGRPPALYPHESDVRNAMRIPYPAEWERLLDTYISPGSSTTAYEDGIALVASLIYQIELAKIFHNLIVNIFENRSQNSTVAAMTAHQIHVDMTNWLSRLPGKLHWNQWTVGRVPSCVLHLHMLFHTGMIILHRPPRTLFGDPKIATSEDTEICYQSLEAILRLLRSYARHYRYVDLPLDVMHILSTAAATVLMKRFFNKAQWTDIEISKPLSFLLGVMDEIKVKWPCMLEIRESITRSISEPLADPEVGPAGEIGPLCSPESAHELPDGQDDQSTTSAGDLGLLMTEDFLSGHFEWDELLLS
ncbi:hypothetical protein A1O1_09123 [Capronia coronata CBS 617.96]|uniref:Xylanolytic transcriptional activator regulatory domain-containing protein n=1 Tax=Capronia coronata CBS 617.96 TaxID=1182541 RepID=W9XP24_9EURO|nr:uncharacterized protein A1O1_09123 [Capronia coronata CBS 617.96]EXJ78721.1 hypothetical protein A1O1_09123 [Capronia coronata CBS 617.96]